MSRDELRQRLAEAERLETEIKRIRAEWRRYKADHLQMTEELETVYTELGRLVANVRQSEKVMSQMDAELRKTMRLMTENFQRLNEAVDEIEDDSWWRGDDEGDADAWKG